MAFQLHDRYQATCQYCFKILEGDSATEAILKAEDHENNECLKNKERRLIASQIVAAQIVSAQTLPESGAPSLCITASDGREIVRITPKGELVVNPEFTTDEAARAFWEAVEKLAARARGTQ